MTEVKAVKNAVVIPLVEIPNAFKSAVVNTGTGVTPDAISTSLL